ncbi:MAG TPA: sigma-70 family RNA polymerase sigma factor [Bacillota bacterium]|nr:sigma-70 family RNA polymerase sigma factor [Bacillota bacterium]
MGEDIEILDQIASGRTYALERLMTKYQSFVYYLALQIVGDNQDAEEVTQEVFWRVYRFAKKFRGDAKVKTWLYTIAVNEARNRLRRKGVSRFAHEDISETELPTDQDLEEGYLLEERSAEIQSAIAKLNPTQQAVILMYYREELSYQEIADIMDVPIGTIKTHLFRGKKSLAKILGEQSVQMKEVAVQ